jgi:hypothetical protein
MITIETQIAEPVLKQAQELAARESIPLEEVISLAVTQAVAKWSNESDMAVRAKEASQEMFLDALTEELNAEPRDGGCLSGPSSAEQGFVS